MRQKFLILLLATASLAYVAYVFQGPEGIDEGQAVPPFVLESREGVLSSEDLRGRVLLINFWATWCPPCRAEMPSLESLGRMMERKPFKVLTVSVDDDWKEIDRFLEETPLTLTLFRDRKADMATRFGTYRLPESYLINKEGILVKKYVGPQLWTEPRIVSEILTHVQDS